MPWSAIVFTAGFVTRAVAAFDAWDNLGLYIASTVLLLAAPYASSPVFRPSCSRSHRPTYEGANYFILGRILYYIPYHSPIHPGRVFTTFIGMGAVIEAITGNGGARVANTSASQSYRDTGKGLLKAALILQLLLMVAFIALAARFQYNCTRGGVLNSKVKRALIVLYTSCTLITIRTIYRTVEYFIASSVTIIDIKDISPVLKHEWFFWVFEAAVMFSNTAMLNVFYPMQWLPRSNKVYLATDGVTEVEGPGYEDKRHFLLTLFDPFDIVGLITKRGKQDKYWETGAPDGVVDGEQDVDAKKTDRLPNEV